MPAKTSRSVPELDIREGATLEEIIEAARKVMTPAQFRDFTRVPKNGAIRTLRVRKGATMKEIYAAARRDFTASDLLPFTRKEKMVPAEDVLAEMEEVHRRTLRQMAKEPEKKRKKPT